jgi:eukaryotic-like serine/threonine-protein kinase
MSPTSYQAAPPRDMILSDVRDRVKENRNAVIVERISRYRVLEEIGRGGMGVVYRARDERLGRDVAVKVLHSASALDEDARKRFRSEAGALSRLSHPSINTVYDFDSENGVDFLVLELVEGSRLDELLASGPLPERDLLEIASQIAGGLAAAHERGIIHRDLKPGNIAVTPKGGVRLLDFGLALLHPTAAPLETRSLGDVGQLAGTLAYIAPERLLGAEADERSDLFSLGAILYEMATGRRPFTAEPATALVNEILHRPVHYPMRAGPELSPGLVSLTQKLLEKDPMRRPGSASEVESSLREILAGRSVAAAPDRPDIPDGAGRIRSLAVLPLENLARDQDQEYFADGMTEALITTLAQIGALRVVSRTSAMQWKGVRRSLPEIARALRVDAVVEGTVARAGDRVRITAQLIEASTDRHLWARSYDRPMTDILDLQGEVAREIAEEIRIQLTPREEARLRKTGRVDPRAYEAYLRGRYHWNRRTKEAIEKGILAFQEAIAADPRYAQAYAGLAQAYDTLGTYYFLAPEEAFAKAESAAARALELDDSLPEAHVARGGVLMSHLWDWPGAEEEFRRAIALDPNHAGAYHWYTDLLSAMGRPDEAYASILRAVELDPLSLTINMTVGAALFYARRYDEAIEQQRKTLELDPTFAPAHRSLGGAYEQKGMYEEAIKEFREATSLSGDLGGPALLAHVYALSGRGDEARRQLAQMIEEETKGRYRSPYSVAAVHVALGERDEAFAWLDRAFLARDRGMCWLKASPRLDPLRIDPRFSVLLRRMKFPE